MLFLKTIENIERPDIQIHFINFNIDKEPMQRNNNINMTESHEDFLNSFKSYEHGFFLCDTLLHPESKGYIDIRSADP